jgi:hypothetical protein
MSRALHNNHNPIDYCLITSICHEYNKINTYLTCIPLLFDLPVLYVMPLHVMISILKLREHLCTAYDERYFVGYRGYAFTTRQERLFVRMPSLHIRSQTQVNGPVQSWHANDHNITAITQAISKAVWFKHVVLTQDCNAILYDKSVPADHRSLYQHIQRYILCHTPHIYRNYIYTEVRSLKVGQGRPTSRPSIRPLIVADTWPARMPYIW